ncbi:transposase [Streptomyces sp. NPDC056682]|uniref:transposase n=1 Tax=Streptomyces sp. NPDC056682 TaxID=3345909 RepID=UPI0036B456EA
MDLGEVEELREDLGGFVAEVFASLARKDQRRHGDCYLRGLMLDGRRKSIQSMAERLPDGNMQALQPFVSQSPWDHTPVLRQIAGKMTSALDPEAWVIDDTSFPKAGDQPCRPAPSSTPTGTVGRIAGEPSVVGHRQDRYRAREPEVSYPDGPVHGERRACGDPRVSDQPLTPEAVALLLAQRVAVHVALLVVARVAV